LRIAYVISEYPYPSHTFVQDEVRGLRSLGLEVDTFTMRRTAAENVLSDGDRDERRSTYAIRPPRLRHFVLAHVRALLASPRRYVDALRRSMALANPGIRSRVWRLMYFIQAVVVWDRCRRRGITHVHAHFANVGSDVAMLAAKLGEGWTWSFTMHGPTEFSELSAHRLAEKTVDASLVVCISDYCRSQLMALVHPEHWQKLRVVHCGVDTGRFTAHNGRHDGVPQIVEVGRLVPVKGQAMLLEAAARLRDAGHRFRLVFVGDGPDMEPLRALAQRLSLTDHTVFRGALAHDGVREVLAASDVMCLPSFAEGVPVVLMEAMSMEVPVVSSRIMGIPELLDDGRYGVLIAPGDVEALSRELATLLEDADRRAELGRRGREQIVANYDRAQCTRALLGLLQERLVRR
jgi:glycosyltransferase involved in cell wall biosynthesis